MLEDYTAAVRAKLLDPNYGQILEPWSPTFGSYASQICTCIKIHLKHIPSHLCTTPIIRYLVKPFCYPQTVDYIDEMDDTSQDYQCIAWCKPMSAIPNILTVKILPASFISMNNIHLEPDIRLATVRIIIEIKYVNPSKYVDLLDENFDTCKYYFFFIYII